MRVGVCELRVPSTVDSIQVLLKVLGVVDSVLDRRSNDVELVQEISGGSQARGIQVDELLKVVILDTLVLRGDEGSGRSVTDGLVTAQLAGGIHEGVDGLNVLEPLVDGVGDLLCNSSLVVVALGRHRLSHGHGSQSECESSSVLHLASDEIG